jgi:DNA-binding response OmpR family regulator
VDRREDRLVAIDPGIRSNADLGIALSTRIEELQRIDRRRRDAQRRAELARDDADESEAQPQRHTRVLLAGPTVSRDQSCIESLRMRDYMVVLAATEAEALATFDSCSPELVVADVEMGRNSGADFVVSLRGVTGIEEVPVLLVDQSMHERRRMAARRVGAAGYLVHPIDVKRIAGRLDHMINEPRRRRWTRYHRRLPVEVHGVAGPCLVTSLGRGGMFVATDEPLPENTVQHCRLSLPELGESVGLEAEVRYRRAHAGRDRGGVGVRFHAFEDRSENLLIEYLRTIAPARSPAAIP